MIYYMIICGLTALLAGYNLGYFHGRKDGLKLGLNQAPLDLMEESLDRGLCLLCGRSVEQATGGRSETEQDVQD